MNDNTLLSVFIAKHGFDEIEAMNILQDRGIISDNAVTSKNVADADFPAARDVLIAVLTPAG